MSIRFEDCIAFERQCVGDATIWRWERAPTAGWTGDSKILQRELEVLWGSGSIRLLSEDIRGEMNRIKEAHSCPLRPVRSRIHFMPGVCYQIWIQDGPIQAEVCIPLYREICIKLLWANCVTNLM